MRYKEKKEAKELIDKMGWTNKIAAPKFGFDHPEVFRQFLKSDRKCIGIEFIRGLEQAKREAEDV